MLDVRRQSMHIVQPQDDADIEFGALFLDDSPTVCLICNNDENKHRPIRQQPKFPVKKQETVPPPHSEEPLKPKTPGFVKYVAKKRLVAA